MPVLGTLPELRAQLRLRAGFLNDTVLMPDPADPAVLSPGESPLDIALADALRAVNRYWPRYSIGSFSTVANQQAYQPLPAGGREVVEVFWSEEACDAALANVWPASLQAELGELAGEVVEGEGGTRIAVLPGALTAFQRHRSTLERWFGRSAVRTDRDTVYLVPRPTTAGTSVYFVYAEDRFDAVGDVTDDLAEVAEAFWCWAEHKTLGIAASGAGAVKRVRGPDGTSVDIDVEGMRESAAMKKSDFFDLIGLAREWWATD